MRILPILFRTGSAFVCVLLGSSSQSPGNPEQPPSVGEVSLEKRLIAKCDRIGYLSDIAVGRIQNDEHKYLIVAGNRGVVLLDPVSAEVKNTVIFEGATLDGYEGMPARVVDVDADGQLEFLRLGRDWVGRTSLHGSDGKVIWIHPEWGPDRGDRMAPEFTSILDLNGDKEIECLMGYNATTEVHLLDHKGNLVWSQEWTSGIVSGSVHFLNGKPGGICGILYVDGEALWARDKKGEAVVRTVPPGGGYVNSLEIVSGWPGTLSSCLLVGHYIREGQDGGQNYHLYDADAKTLMRGVSRDEVANFINAEEVRFSLDVPSYLTAENVKRLDASGKYFGRAIRIRMCDASGDVVYEDFVPLPEGMEATDSPPRLVLSDERGAPRILVGCGDSIWEYFRRE